MQTHQLLQLAFGHIKFLTGREIDVLTITKPKTVPQAVNLAKLISKLSPIVGNLIEFNTVEFLNAQPEYRSIGEWIRQDPGFPDAVFGGDISPTPGLEIKAWFPLATEITARFKDSQDHFLHDQTYVCILAWLPDQLVFGKPRVIDLCIVSGRSVAEARDTHYHNPPDYLVIEPEDTTDRTRNLQQTNTNGYKFQGSSKEFVEAQKLVDRWGPSFRSYRTSPQYQALIRDLQGRYTYRLDTNYAKMDRIAHSEIEEFKRRVLESNFHGQTIGGWSRLLSKGQEAEKRIALQYLIQEK